MIELFLTIYIWSLTVPCLLITFIICLIVYPFVSQKKFSRIYEITLGNMLIFIMKPFWSFTIKDLRKNKEWSRFVIVANHVSFVDSLIIGLIPLEKKFMIAEIFTKIPIFGWLTNAAGFVHADLKNPEVNKVAVQKSINAMKDGSSFAIFPEGRRSLRPYELMEFKTGAFRIAYQTGVPILPVTLKGTYEGMKFWGITGMTDIEMIIHEPFYVSDEDYYKWSDKAKELIKKGLEN